MMTERMDLARFGDLADAYGGDLRRWPEDVRDTARAFADAYPVDAERTLFEARQTDTALFASPNPVVSMALRDRVLASATMKARSAWPSLKKLLWIGGVGWAAAACAGVMVGTTLSSHLAVETQADVVLEQAMLGGIDETEVLG